MITLIELLCLGLAGWAAKLSLYTPPQFDWKQSFGFSLARSNAHPDTDIYPPCLGSSWENFDIDIVQKRHQHQFSHVILFTLSPSSLANRLQTYLQISHHVVSPKAEEIAPYVHRSAQRLLFLCSEEEVQDILALLKKHPGMRDVLYGVVVLNPIFDQQWMDSYFDQDILDTEANTPVPYIFCNTSEENEMPTPRESKTGWRSISAISLDSVDLEHQEIPMALAALFSALYS